MIRSRKKNKSQHKHKRRGRPKRTIVPEDFGRDERPEDYPTLLKYLESQGNVKHTTRAQMLRARHLIYRGMSAEDVAASTKVPVEVVDRWAMVFAWYEERDRREFQLFRSLRDRLPPDTDERHDRIAGTLESVAEKLLCDCQAGRVALKPSELAAISKILKDTMDVRRTVRGKSGPVEKKALDITLDSSESMNKLAEALGGAMGVTPLVAKPQQKLLEIRVGNEEHVGTDEEYDEESDDD